MSQYLGFELREDIFTDENKNSNYARNLLNNVTKIEFYIRNIMGPYYKAIIEVDNDNILIKKGYSLLGHCMDLDEEGTDIDFIKAVKVAHIHETVDNYRLFLFTLSKINLYKCGQPMDILNEDREVYWDLKMSSKSGEIIGVEGLNYTSSDWCNLITLISILIEDNLHRKMGMI